MKKKYLFLSVIFTCVISLLTSCVNDGFEDFYEEMDFSMPRNKRTKDINFQSSSQEDDQFPLGFKYCYYEIHNATSLYCWKRALDHKYGEGNWLEPAKTAILRDYNKLSEREQKKPKNRNKYFIERDRDNITVDVESLLNSGTIDYQLFISIVRECGNSSSELIVGKICVITDTVNLPKLSTFHAVYIVSRKLMEGRNIFLYTDSDGNVWQTELLGVI